MKRNRNKKQTGFGVWFVWFVSLLQVIGLLGIIYLFIACSWFGVYTVRANTAGGYVAVHEVQPFNWPAIKAWDYLHPTNQMQRLSYSEYDQYVRAPQWYKEKIGRLEYYKEMFTRLANKEGTPRSSHQ